MNIAVICPRSLDFETGRQQTYRVESKILTLLSERGHRVTMYTGVNSDYTPNENVRLKDTQLGLDDDEDVLFCVNGAWGEIFINRFSARCYNFIHEWSGTLIYSQNDPKMPLVWNPERIFQKSREELAQDLVCEREEIFDGVDRTIILTNSMNVDHARGAITDKHNPYDGGAPFECDIRFHDLCAYVVQDLPVLSPRLTPALKEPEPAVYVGNYRPRTRSFRRLFEDTGEAVACYGKGWDRQKGRFKRLTAKGHIKHAKVAKTYRRYEWTATIFDDKQAGSSAITLRLFESILGGCLTFVDTEIWESPLDCPLGESMPEVMVSDAGDILTLLEETRSTPLLREEVIACQQEDVLAWADIDYLLEELELILKEAQC